MVKNRDLPKPPDGKVRVIDKAELLYVTLTDDGFEPVFDVKEHHLEDREAF